LMWRPEKRRGGERSNNMNPIPRQVREVNTEIEAATRRGQFLTFCRFLLLASKGSAGGPITTCANAAGWRLQLACVALWLTR
jgi:hypothetical protein